MAKRSFGIISIFTRCSSSLSSLYSCPSSSVFSSSSQNMSRSITLYTRSTSKKKDSDSEMKLSHLNKILMNVVNKSAPSQESLNLLENDEKLFPSTLKEEISLEKQLRRLMRFWQIDEAICLLRESISEGKILDATVLYTTLLQIAEIGKLDCLLDLRDLKFVERQFISQANWYRCLCLAVYNSGRIEAGMELLKEEYDEGQTLDNTEALFSILSTMILKDFPHYYPMVEDFVAFLMTREPPVSMVQGWLWKCLVIAERFEEALEMQERQPELKKMIPAQVVAIIQTSSHIEFDRDSVFVWLMTLPDVKVGLKGNILHLLVQRKCDENAWSEAVDHIVAAMDKGVTVHPMTLQNFLTCFFDHFSEENLHFWKVISSGFQDMGNTKKGCSLVDATQPEQNNDNK